MVTIEQKAKAYDEAMKRAKVFKEHLLEINEKDYADEIDYIFPELTKSEDEIIREEIIDFLRLPHPQFVGKRDHEQWITWLEKQSKPTEIPDDAILDGNNDGLIADTIRCKIEKQGEQKPAWKPSKEQFELLKHIIRNVPLSHRDKSAVWDLYLDLKRLELL